MRLRKLFNRANISVLLLTGLVLVLPAQAQTKTSVESVKTVKSVRTSKKSKSRSDTYGPFVPPPPPNIPAFSGIGDMGAIDFDLSGLTLMSESDLKTRLSSCELRLKNAQSKLKDQTDSVDESNKRAKSFVELFEQGIVSKKELEGSSKDADQAVSDLEESKSKCKDLELSVKAIKDRLSVLQKRKTISKSNANLIGSFDTRKQNKSKARPPSKQKTESKSLSEEKASDKNKK